MASADNEICILCRSLKTERSVYENALWHLRSIEPPVAVAGWMIMIAKRHVSGPGYFDDGEALQFGVALRHFARVLEQVTGALRIYTAALGEAVPHFHCHLVPRYSDAPKIGWNLFDLQRAAKAGEVVVPETQVARVIEDYRLALAENPLTGA